MNSIIGGLKEGWESKLGSPQDRIKSKMKRCVFLLHWCVEDSEYLTFTVNRGGMWATREQWGVLVHIFPRGRLRLRGVQKRRLPWYLKGALSKMHKNNGRGPLKAKVNLSPPAVTCPVMIGSSRVVTFRLWACQVYHAASFFILIDNQGIGCYEALILTHCASLGRDNGRKRRPGPLK